jgi:hypothetical protein
VQVLGDDDLNFEYFEEIRTYGFRYLDGGTSFQQINFCPWCGTALPDSLSDIRSDLLEQMGFDVGVDDLPTEFESDEWWVARGL